MIQAASKKNPDQESTTTINCNLKHDTFLGCGITWVPTDKDNSCLNQD